jgi:hypothetical protein
MLMALVITVELQANDYGMETNQILNWPASIPMPSVKLTGL